MGKTFERGTFKIYIYIYGKCRWAGEASAVAKKLEPNDPFRLTDAAKTRGSAPESGAHRVRGGGGGRAPAGRA